MSHVFPERGPYREVVVSKEGEHLGARGLDAANRRDSLKFYRADCVEGGFQHVVHLVERGARVWYFVTDPISCLSAISVRGWAPRYTGSDDVLATFVGGMEAHSQRK